MLGFGWLGNRLSSLMFGLVLQDLSFYLKYK